jgi:hypothetical protein
MDMYKEWINKLPQKCLNWIFTERRKGGKPNTRWKEGVLTVR